MLGQELGRPIVKSDQPLRLWCLATKGYTDLEINPISAKQAWQEPRRLLTGWARTNGRRAQKASWESLHFRRVTAVDPQRWWRLRRSTENNPVGTRWEGTPAPCSPDRRRQISQNNPRFSGLVEARVWSQCLRASRRRAFSDSRPAATQACPRCAFQSIAQSAERRR